VPVGVVAAITLVFGLFASKLELRTRYEALLPDSQPSVTELRRVQERTALAQTVLVLLEGEDRAVLRSMGDALVPALRSLGPDVVSSVEDGPHDTRAFLEPRAGLFLERAALEKLSADVDARWDYEVAKETDALLDEDDPPPPLTATELKRRFEPKGQDDVVRRFPDGYYERADGHALVVIARSPVVGGDLARAGAVMATIRGRVATVRAPRPSFGAIRVSYAGDMPTGLAEYGVVRDDLLSVGASGIALVLGAVLLYFMRLRALLVMGVSIVAGLVWTFGLTQMAIGHLNIATAFLVSIVAGNGINVGILYQSRYFEERQRGASTSEALQTAVRTTWLPTVVAALAAAASYGSLLVTDFRAFRDFGFIAASGMLLCWVVQTLAVLPLLVLLDRRPIERAPWAHRFGMTYGRLFAWLVPKAPRTLFAAGLCVAVLGGLAAIRYATSDPLEYDMRKVQSDSSATANLQRTWSVCNEVLGASQGGMVIVTDTADDARELQGVLDARWASAPMGAKPFKATRSLWSFVAKDQEAKMPTLLALGARLERAHEKGFVTDADWRELAPMLPPQDLVPFGIDDLPDEVARSFTDKSGARGTLVFVEGESGTSDDLRYLLRYADSFRETRLPSGKIVRGSGSAVIFADMLKSVVRDIPRAVSLSLGLTLIAVLMTFGRSARSLAVLFALAVGSGGVALFLYLARVKLNFLNFAALPITFGIGVDYAVNVAQRYYGDVKKSVVTALRTSGGAVVLCSLTTILGYLALLGSHNQAIRSLGMIGVVGEASCLLSAVLVLPAMWLTLNVRTARVANASHSTASVGATT
jgi:predicted RND superfamily exporter protein